MAIDFETTLLSLIVGSTRAANKLKAHEGVSLLRRLYRRDYLNLLDLAINEEVRIKLLLSNVFWEVSDPEFPNSLTLATAAYTRLSLLRNLRWR